MDGVLSDCREVSSEIVVIRYLRVIINVLNKVKEQERYRNKRPRGKTERGHKGLLARLNQDRLEALHAPLLTQAVH